ncbi:amidase signature domain-containing protein [Podospora aff. communis PSN243]|uniref:Amidase signature domain-containing protein n=1 Tax=Podospora aff. communis PSN243 TaxID=3040156 RepID=A0AAV9GS31_9PEZI|nr:amidase signature domain-containing protein [Podospora aff. communis PSN243]
MAKPRANASRAPRPWREIVAQKLQEDDAKIPPQWRLSPDVISSARLRKRIAGDFIESLLDRETRRITSTDALDLVAAMKHGSLTAVVVVTAYCKRAAYAHQLSNILLEIGFDEALARAKELDDYFNEHGKLVGPLHGLPVTLKDQFHVKGLTTSMGFVGWINTFEGEMGTGKERHFESEVVRELVSLGAVPIGKAPETNNNILGYTRNPWNQQLSSGGSSGGEGVMQALRGSVFGLGTDIGGSPSSGRISFKGVASTGPGQQVMPAVVGLMGSSLATLESVFKSLLLTEPWLHDPYTSPLPWQGEKEYNVGTEHIPTPAFGFFANDGIVTPHPPISRALRIVREALEECEYELLDWHPPSNQESGQIHGQIARGNACRDAWEAIKLSGEPIVPEISNLFPGGKLRQPLSLWEFEKVVLHMKDFRNRYNEYWMVSAEKTRTGRPVQAVIAPATPYAGIMPGKFKYSEYTNSLNVLDLPAVVIPVTFADKSVDRVSPDFEPLSDLDRGNMEIYDPEVHDGAPAAVQIFGRRWDEERLLSLAQLVVGALDNYAHKRGKRGLMSPLMSHL